MSYNCIFFLHRIFEEIQKIEDNEFHYQEQVLEVKFFLKVFCDQVETGVDLFLFLEVSLEF